MFANVLGCGDDATAVPDSGPVSDAGAVAVPDAAALDGSAGDASTGSDVDAGPPTWFVYGFEDQSPGSLPSYWTESQADPWSGFHFLWSAGGQRTEVSDSQAFEGTRAMRFAWLASGEDNQTRWGTEVRYSFTPEGRLHNAREWWVRFKLYVPSSYSHSRPSTGNNRKTWFFYDHEDSRFYLDFERWSMSDGTESSLSLNLAYWAGSERINIGHCHPGKAFITTADRGTWIDVAIHVKMDSAADVRDGFARVYKAPAARGLTASDLYHEYRESPACEGWNYGQTAKFWGGEGVGLGAGYILGYANAAYEVDTEIFLDQLEWSTRDEWSIE